MKDLEESLKIPWQQGKEARSIEVANQFAEDFFIPPNQPLGLLQTPVESLLFFRGALRHLVEKRTDKRERYLPMIRETLKHPFEVWRVYEDGVRNHSIGAFKGDKNMFCIVRIKKDGNVFWNAIRKDRTPALNQSRQGHLIYGQKTE